MTIARPVCGVIVTKISDLAHKYRWELTLFIGIPLAVDAVSWALWQFISVRPGSLIATVTFHSYQFLGIPYSFIILKALSIGILWLRVRHLKRRYLSLIWLYALASATAVVILPIGARAIGYIFVDYDPDFRPFLWLSYRHYWLAQTIMQFSILVYFAVLISKISLRHAVLFIGLSAAVVNGIDLLNDAELFIYHSVITLVDASDNVLYSGAPYFNIPSIVFSVIMSLLAVGLLASVDNSRSRKSDIGIVAIFVFALLLKIPYGKLIWIAAWHYSGNRGFVDTVLNLGSVENFVIGYGLILTFTYAMWTLFSRKNAHASDALVTDTSQTHNANGSLAETSPQDAGRSP